MSNCGLAFVLEGYDSSASLPTESARKNAGGRAKLLGRPPHCKAPSAARAT